MVTLFFFLYHGRSGINREQSDFQMGPCFLLATVKFRKSHSFVVTVLRWLELKDTP